MEHFDYKFHRGFRPEFDAVPAEHRPTLMGVDYAHLRGQQGGDLYVTRNGWGCIDSLLPETWFIGEKFRKVGRALAGATGAVYRVPVRHTAQPDFSLVVKFSRSAQDIGITVLDNELHLDAGERAQIDQAEFLSPFAEFSNVYQLRAKAGSAIRTMQPLAIYSPPTRYANWQLGRKQHLTDRMNNELLASQDGVPEKSRIAYEWERLYILLYRWVGGIDAEQARAQGLISQSTMIELGQQARETLRRYGWMVCDHKPRHVIVRPRSSGSLLKRRGSIAWAIIDFELLVPQR